MLSNITIFGHSLILVLALLYIIYQICFSLLKLISVLVILSYLTYLKITMTVRYVYNVDAYVVALSRDILWLSVVVLVKHGFFIGHF